MNVHGFRSQNVRNRLHRRLHQRYLRWLARQPVESVFLSEGWRSFWRSYRRRANDFFRTPLVQILIVCLAVCALLLILAGAVAAVACVLYAPPAILFAPPEHVSFTGLAQRDAVALTRLTVLQSMIVPSLFLWATLCFRNWSGLEAPAFYQKYRSSRLVGYSVAFLCFLGWSVAATIGATIGHGTAFYSIVAALTVTGCLGWLAWTGAKRLMAVRCSHWLSSSETAAATLGLPLLLLLPVISALFGPAVFTISRYLQWLGPFGWLNDLLLSLSFGRTLAVLPFGICCVITLALGFWLNSPTSNWAFRRRLLSKYRTRTLRRCVTSSTTGEQHFAHDLRQALSRHNWQSILYPRWTRGYVTRLLLLCGTVFAVQLILAGLILFLESVERQTGLGISLREARSLRVMLSCAPGWNVLLIEAIAISIRDRFGVWEFARRPVSPGQVWKQLQWDGAISAPTQTLLALPSVALVIVVAPAYGMNSCCAVVVALLACVAIRTTLSAGSCYFASITHLKQWTASILLLVGTFGALVLIWGAAASGFAICMNPDWTPGENASTLLLQQVVPLTALAIACGVWCAVGYSRHEAMRTSRPLQRRK